MSAAISLPRLRENLNIYSEEPDKGQYSSSWVIYDAISHTYYEIGRVEFLILSLWHLGNKERIIETLEREYKKNITPDHFEDFFKFLIASNLLVHSPYKEAMGPKSEQHWFFKSRMLFYHRVNLLRPEKILTLMQPYVCWMFARSFHCMMMLVILFGVLGVVQNFNSYQSTFVNFLSLDHIVLWFMALMIVKIAHEFSHALTAKHYGCSVATMGVAFIIFWPVLYTDTTNAWSLHQKRQRIFISAAGVISEIYIAAICSLIWLFFPDGALRTIAFMLSSTAWITSLFINLNPFMKFDGYFILSDLVKVKNLHSAASFYMNRYFDTIFLGRSISAPLPHVKPSIRPKLAWFGLFVLIYRAVITLSIIWLIYTLLFKLLAVLLIMTYIMVSVMYPLYKKFKNVLGSKSVELSRKKLLRSGIIVAVLLGIFFYPWKASIQFPALMHFKDTSVLYVEEDAVVATVHVKQGDYVKTGDVLVVLRSESLNHDISRIGHELEILNWKLRSSTLYEEDNELIQSNIKEIEEKQSEYQEAMVRKGLLTMKAPHDGLVYFPDFYLQEQMAFKQEQPIISIVNDTKRIVTGYVEGNQMSYFDNSVRQAFFYPDDISFERIPIHIHDFSAIGVKEITQPYMASIYGGPIAAQQDEEGILIPERGVYLLTSEIKPHDIQDISLTPMIVKGVVYIDSKPYSMAKRFFDFILSGFMKHSSF